MTTAAATRCVGSGEGTPREPVSPAGTYEMLRPPRVRGSGGPSEAARRPRGTWHIGDGRERWTDPFTQSLTYKYYTSCDYVQRGRDRIVITLNGGKGKLFGKKFL